MRNSITIGQGIGLGGGNYNSATINTLTPVTVKGGVVRVIDSATGDIASNTSGWIEDEKYGWYANGGATAYSIEFDTAVTRTGTKTLKVSNTDITGTGFSAITGGGGSTYAGDNGIHLIPIKPSTTYKISCYIKTNNTAVGAVTIAPQYWDSNKANRVTPTASTSLYGTNDWTLKTVSFTTNATGSFLRILLNNSVAGNISDAWFDVNSMTLTEVSTITNSGSTPALLYPKVTAVTSNDNIDQSQVDITNATEIGNATRNFQGQQFLPTKKNLVGVYIKKSTGAGIFTGTITFSIQTDLSDAPSGTVVGTPVTISNATWEGLTVDVDYLIPYSLTLDVTKKYWLIITASTSDASNYARLRVGKGNLYANGLAKWSTNGTTSWTVTANDWYFKTLYSKNTTNFTVSTDTQTISVTAPTTDGWSNGTVIDTANLGVTPLTLASGVNNIYVSSNGQTIADGTVDASLQCIVDGHFLT